MRIALGIEYDGSPYHGWQRQGHEPNTVQQILESALSQVADHPVTVICCGRTDAGVHGYGQVVHFDTHAMRTPRAWIHGANAALPHSISVRWSQEVPEHFHARFSAYARRYCYVIYNHPIRPALGMRHMTWQYRPLDERQMEEGAQALVGTHDFTSFRALGCQAKSPIKTIHSIRVERRGAMIFISVHANAYLHHMVRNIAGVLMAVGTGKAASRWVKEVLELRDRSRGGVTAPPYGLYFMEAQYPDEFCLPREVHRLPPVILGGE
ncbi:tRNA pseudouridine synthase A [gamma proteobacterium HdN1]|nr:tRNA pseudouridine synthase A [gamma proteobacterium HdN1]